MSYKILGDFIRKVDNKNKDMKVLNLQGLSMTKEFRKSTSNIVGTDLSKYKIVKQGQFCCDFMSVIRVHKLPVVLNNLGEDVIISPAYVVFEVIDENLLLPEYLMLWFRRTEFDRYADFRCDSSIRGGFQWEELCEVELPIPSIEKQREIVAQYQAVENKIKVNEQICEKLEAAAQALYKHWFVDFEFPYSPPQEGCPQDGVVNTPSIDTFPQDGVVNTPINEEGPQDGVVNANVPRSTQNYKSLPYNPALKERAKELRKAGNLAEVLFWQQVRNRQFKGLDFDRQKIIGNYIVDFYNANYQLVVEIDGSSHNDKQDYDASRQKYLEDLGLKVVRYTDIEVKRNIVSVMQHLSDYIDAIQQASTQTEEINHNLQAGEIYHPALEEDEINHPAFQAPLQRRGMMGYKSSGGKMVWNEELEKEIPEGWEVKSLGDFIQIKNGKVRPEYAGKIPVYGGNGIIDYVDKSNYSNINIIGRVGAYCGAVYFNKSSVWVSDNALAALSKCNTLYHDYLLLNYLNLNSRSEGSSHPLLTQGILNNIRVLKCENVKIYIEFENIISPLFEDLTVIKLQNQKLIQLQSLLLSRLATLEG